MAIASAFAVVLPSVAAAQSDRGFTDSWFWGVKAGGFTLADSGQRYIQAPMAGVDWMITRTHGGLYASLGEAFFSQHTFTLRDPSAPADSGLRPISLKNMRKLDVALVGFPGDHTRFHPYAGIGFTMGAISTATPVGPFATDDQLTFANNVVSQERVAFSPLLMAGAQVRLTHFSVFGQGLMNPTNKSFLLYNGKAFNFEYELGLRYNVGSSIER
ncbi:MAG TPA: hypothetical protein VHV78_07265 [Gemmatimonadaceae bacterium]|nr:hypothetical protein [Gemmatimonadaceae bacterium]